MRKNSIKNIRINEEVMRELSNIIRGEIKDPRINPMTSVVTVEVAPDLKTCKAYISVLGDEESQKATLAGLRSAEGYIRRQLAHSINLRNTPEITFVLDQSIEYGVRMSKMIDDVTKDIPDRADEAEEETDCLCRLKNGEQGAKEELVLHNMRLVAHVAKKYVSSEEEQEDLISIGTIGLMKAVDSFRPEYGNKFATYAIRCVDNELLMHLRSKKKQRKEVSMFEPIGTDKEGNQIQLVDVLEFHDKNVADEVTKREQMKKICTFMNDVLSEREAFIIRRRYGIGGNQELTQREIARALGISRSYVSRIEKRALEKLKKVISE